MYAGDEIRLPHPSPMETRTGEHGNGGRKPIDIHVGRRFAEKRQERRLTQADRGDGIGVTASRIAAYENGDQRIVPAHLIRIADYLRVTLAYFFEGA